MIGNIYAIVCNETGEMYIGSTSKHVEFRLEQHKSSFNKCSSKQIIDRNNYKLKILETLTVDNKNEILLREKHWIHQSKIACEIEGGAVINKANPFRTEEEMKEYTKKYQDSHKDYFKAKREEHKEKWMSDYQCPCGATCRLINKNRHEQSLEHKIWFEKQNLILFDL